MGEVTIDSIQIEIESNSTNAVRGLDALAGSLEKLKKNGSLSTIVNNLFLSLSFSKNCRYIAKTEGGGGAACCGF